MEFFSLFNLPPEPTILKMTSPTTGKRYEWHRLVKKLYIVDLEANMATLIAEGVVNHGMAINLVNMWTRGYVYAQEEEKLKGESNGVKQRAAEKGILAVAEPD